MRYQKPKICKFDSMQNAFGYCRPGSATYDLCSLGQENNSSGLGVCRANGTGAAGTCNTGEGNTIGCYSQGLSPNSSCTKGGVNTIMG